MADHTQVADELYPETIHSTIKKEPDNGEDVDLEEMLKRELAEMSVDKKSTRFRTSRSKLTDHKHNLTS